MKTIALVCVTAAFVTDAACAGRTSDAITWPPAIQAIASPAAAGSGQPHLNVQGDRVLMSWLEQTDSGTTLKFADRTATGWSEPRVVASGDDWFVNSADVPSVVRLDDGSLAAHWLQSSDRDNDDAYDLRLAFSADGRTWSAPTSPHHDGTRTQHGFASLFQPTAGAGLGLVWLDGRAMREMKPGDREDMNIGSMSLRSAVFDRKGVQLSEALVDDRVCDCCPTALAVTSDGPIVAYRNRTDDEIRDIYVSRLVGAGWSEPAPVHRDNWHITACPVNGPALRASGRDVAIAWFTAPADEGHVFAAFSRDGGKTFGTPVRVDDVGALGRVDLEFLPDHSAIVSWIEFADGRSQLRIRRVGQSESRSDSISVAGVGASRAGGYPHLARHGDELIVVWTDMEGGSRVRTASARLHAP